ncbi:MAG: helix-turn-helix transcriptional regulator [Acidobacteriota bacterium]|nr:helix-turn-helix transcriptional regulator [Acidobacteriota bacterium]
MRVIRPRLRQTPLPPLSPDIKRTRPRSFVEWKTLRRWGKLPPWEEVFPGYLLREAREAAGLSQSALAAELGCSQQAVARAERPVANPTFALLSAWAAAVGGTLEVSIRRLSPAGGEAVPSAASGPPAGR